MKLVNDQPHKAEVAIFKHGFWLGVLTTLFFVGLVAVALEVHVGPQNSEVPVSRR